MYRPKPTAGIGNGAVAAAVTSIVVTVLAVVIGGVRRSRVADVRAEREVTTPSPARPPAATTTGFGGASA